MIGIHFKLFTFFNKIGNYFYGKYCKGLHSKQGR